jgi:hypothetical protein
MFVVVGLTALLGSLPTARLLGEETVTPRRQIEERPFGGPPPSGRAASTIGKKCKTPVKTCELNKPRPIGRKCICWGVRPSRGTVVE